MTDLPECEDCGIGEDCNDCIYMAKKYPNVKRQKHLYHEEEDYSWELREMQGHD